METNVLDVIKWVTASQQNCEKLYTMVQESNKKIAELTDRIKELEEENKSLRGE